MTDDSEELSRLVHELNDSLAAPRGSRHDSPRRDPAPVLNRLDEYLRAALERGASDVLLVAGSPPTARVHGALVELDAAALGPAETKSVALLLLDELRYRQLQRDKASDFGFDRPGLGRFRCNLHHQQGSLAVSIRILPAVIPSLEDLNLPSTYGRLTSLPRGLVLFCGPTGCGKSTTMAALIQAIRAYRAAHIVTIEDPVEYLHPPGRGIIEQIEIGRDAVSFAAALRHALRQNPDVILLGEMLDLETISIALTAAETGHVVLSTLHTQDAAQTMDRIVDVFPESQQSQVRQQLSLALAAVAVQSLVPTASADMRVPACEILLANDAIRNLIRTGKNHLIYSQITIGRKDGMMTMEDSLAALLRKGRITREEARLRAGHPDELDKLLA